MTSDGPKLSVQQILAFEADCLETNIQRRAEAARRHLGIKARSYVPMLVRCLRDEEWLRRALELDPQTTNRTIDRLERSTASRERLTGRSGR